MMFSAFLLPFLFLLLLLLLLLVSASSYSKHVRTKADPLVPLQLLQLLYSSCYARGIGFRV